MKSIAFLACAAMLGSPGAVSAAQCNAASGAQRVPLLELYTSEGCDSCPPTDRWVSALPSRGLSARRVVTLAFHVDYWNYLGWADPFAQARFSERQRWVSLHNRARFVYTPQLVLNGRDYRRGTLRDDFSDKVGAINREHPKATIMLRQNPPSDGTLEINGTVTVHDAGERRNAQVYIALYENNLANEVTAGENRGKKLQHDFVVRDLAGPFPGDASAKLSHGFKLGPRWKVRDLQIAAFVQNQQTGEVLQALALPRCL